MNVILAIQGSVIASSIVVFLLLVLLLVSVLLYAKKKLTPSGTVTLDINEGEKKLTVERGKHCCLPSVVIKFSSHPLVVEVVPVPCAVVRYTMVLDPFCRRKRVILPVRNRAPIGVWPVR